LVSVQEKLVEGMELSHKDLELLQKHTRQGFYIHGKYFDNIVLSILKSEFDSRIQAKSIVQP